MIALMAILGMATGVLLVIAFVSRSGRRRSTSDGGDVTMVHSSGGAEFSDSDGCSDSSSGGDGGGCGDGGGDGGGGGGGGD